MPRSTENAPRQQDHLEFDDPDEVDEEEVEYEEIEEEVEYEEVEEDEEEEEEENSEVACELDAKHDSKMVDQKDEEEKEKHAELLALPPHGSEVYVGGISSDTSSEDIKKLFESVGEVVEVSTTYFLWLSFCICFVLQFKVCCSCRCEHEERGMTSCMLLLVSELKNWL